MTTNYLLFLIATLALTAFIGYGTFATARLLRTWTPDRNLLLMPAENWVRLGMIALCGGLAWLSGLPRVRFGLAPLSTNDVLVELVWGVTLGAALAALIVLTTRWLLQQPFARDNPRVYATTILDHVLPRSRDELFAVSMVMVSVVVLEELLFRGLLVGGLATLLPAWVLVVGWGVIFGLLHSPQGIWGMIGAGLAGVGLGALFLWRGTLLTPLVAHYVANMGQIGLAMRADQPGGPKV